MTQNFGPIENNEGQLIYRFTDNNPPISSITIYESSIMLAADKRYSKLPPFIETMGGFENRGSEVIDKFEKKVSLRGAIETIITLSQNIERGSEIDYAPLEDTTATRIIADILKKRGKKPSEVGLAELTIDILDARQMEERGMTEQRGLLQNYTINYPHSVITGASGMPAFNSTAEESSRLFVADKYSAKQVVEALSDSGINAEILVYTPKIQDFKKGLAIDTTRPEEVTVQVASKALDKVLGALQGRDDIIPSFITDEIIAKTKELRPQTVAGADDQMALKEVRTSSKKERATTPKPNTGKG